jgi:AraC family transcriptional regulator of adaptative response / DNA-3-methyladenine glycosylase II
MTFERGAIRCEVTSSTIIAGDDTRRAHGVALRILGLHLDPAPFEQRVARTRALRPLVNGRAGLRMPLMADPFEALVWGIVGQQVNLPFAYRLRRVIIDLVGADAGGGLRAHPDAAAVAALDYEDLTRRQFSRRKAEYIIDTARAVASGTLDLDAMSVAAAPAAERRLLDVRGLGPWSAQYMLMRGFGFADCVPAGDSGLATALERFFALAERPDPTAARRLMEAFSPYRTLATFHLWTSLGESP